ncbi:hypothetical protein LPU83_2834 [Rhizobium favelukesii]|uniref:Uncharacterized protein n=1 Tax=Rhizobium favelukesii TaxID=348824 RepID=W6RDW3_9HYPH|nr:hypothetical protein LPU83_2834 [Rhizobium favelukesii]
MLGHSDERSSYLGRAAQEVMKPLRLGRLIH